MVVFAVAAAAVAVAVAAADAAESDSDNEHCCDCSPRKHQRLAALHHPGKERQSPDFEKALA